MIAMMPAIVAAQPIFSEDFENLGPYVPGQLGPAALVAEGWIFRVQSGNPSPPYGWRHLRYFPPGCGFETFAPQGGSGYLITDAQSGWNPPPVIANWAILPVVPGQAAGQVLSFWARREITTATESFEVRYSASGGTSTGSGPTGVGNFTQVLLTAAPLPNTNWAFYSATIPGTGRIAIRYYATGSIAGCGTDAAIDTLSIGPPAGPCTGYPTIPTVGQTVTWTTAGGPYHICTHTVIPVGATVIVESGAEVFVDPGSDLVVRGALQVQAGARVDTRLDVNDPNAAQGSVEIHGAAELLGTPASPVRLTGNARGRGTQFTRERFGAMPGGKITASHVDLTTTLSAIGSGVVVADHVVVSGAPTGFNYNGFYCGRSSDVTQVPGGTIALRDSHLEPQTELYVQEGYILVDNVSFDNATYEHQRVYAAQSMYLNNLDAQNNPGSTFVLRGFNFFFGPENLITNNGFPVIAEQAGIARGSTIPTTGNANNMVSLAFGHRIGETTYSRIGVPYRVDTDGGTGADYTPLVVEPGVTIKMGPGATLSCANFNMRLVGLPNDPITIERLDPAQPWFSLWKAFNEAKLEHVILRGGQRGIDADASDAYIDSCLFETNAVGAMARNSSALFVHKCRFFDNASGIQSRPDGGAGPGIAFADGEGTPNWFEGNTAGVETLHATFNDFARDNYWGDPSGPNDPSNPGGTGDTAPGPNLVVPFLSAVQNFADTPPVVRLRQHARLMEAGDRMILHWEASDDVAIDHFEIWLKPHGQESDMVMLAGNIPAAARSWEIVIPPMQPSNLYSTPNAFDVIAFDNAGQKAFDEILFETPDNASLSFSGTVLAPTRVLRPGERLEICRGAIQCDGVCENMVSTAYLELHADTTIPLEVGPFSEVCALSFLPVPPVSTDLARNVYRSAGAGGRTITIYSDFYAIRPDPAIGDAPPLVALSAPTGPSYSGGTAVPIAWTASDDESLRSFDIHASYNNGRTWSTVVDNLPGADRAYSWRLPPSTGIAQVRVRVVARDLRFQVSSSTSNTFEITPGASGIPGDVDGDGHVTLTDLALLLSSFGLCSGDAGYNAAADFDNTNCVELGDLAVLLANFGS